MKKQYVAQPSKRNDWERLHEVYPQLRQMTYNKKGYDYLLKNSHGVMVRIEEKYRDKNNKYEITPAQQKIADIFSLLTWDGKYYHMLAKDYHALARPHSALASGHFEKITELSQKRFILHATTDLIGLADRVVHEFGTLEDFFA